MATCRSKDKEPYGNIPDFLKMYLTVVVEGAARNHAKLEDVTSTIA